MLLLAIICMTSPCYTGQ